MAKRPQPSFADCMAMMRKRSALTREEGFYALRPRAMEFVAELMREFAIEPDHGLRCWLFELVGEARSAEAFDFPCAQAQSADEALRG